MAETYTGHVRDGVVVFDAGTPPLPEGTPVRIQPHVTDQDVADLRALLLELAGKAEGLPADLAEQHDHYLHGQPKR